MSFERAQKIGVVIWGVLALGFVLLATKNGYFLIALPVGVGCLQPDLLTIFGAGEMSKARRSRQGLTKPASRSAPCGVLTYSATVMCCSCGTKSGSV